jgi:hypothetical protein
MLPAKCSNHSSGTQGSVNQTVAGIRSLFPTTLRLSLKKKAQQFSLARVNRPARVTFDALIQRTKTRQRMTNRNCGWHGIYPNRFMIPNSPCPHTALDSGLRIDWDRAGMSLKLEARHELVITLPIQAAGCRLRHQITGKV